MTGDLDAGFHGNRVLRIRSRYRTPARDAGIGHPAYSGSPPAGLQTVAEDQVRYAGQARVCAADPAAVSRQPLVPRYRHASGNPPIEVRLAALFAGLCKRGVVKVEGTRVSCALPTEPYPSINADARDEAAQRR